eukprot:4329929-Lingulodinium_polyedra.AAC.1
MGHGFWLLSPTARYHSTCLIRSPARKCPSSCPGAQQSQVGHPTILVDALEVLRLVHAAWDF